MTTEALTVDRGTGRVSCAGFIDRLMLAGLDGYARISAGWMQRGLYKLCRLAGRRWSGREASIILSADTAVSFPASDPYWNRMLLRSYDHEPEMARFLKRLIDVDYTFVDCGANIGYWSVFVASPGTGGGKPVLSVEASASTFDRLTRNAAPWADQINLIHRAIFNRSGERVCLNTDAHEARGIDAGGTGGEPVETITVDDLVAAAGWINRRLVIKLDVEGVEKEALAGMKEVLARDPLIIYEDHGADATNTLTGHMIDDLGLEVHLLLDNQVVCISRPSELISWKKDVTKGYNLIAVQRGSSWASKIG